MIKNTDVNRKNIIFAIICITFLFCSIFYLYIRFLPPSPNKKINQQIHRNLIKENTGIFLPEGAIILSGSDGEARDGTKGFFYWIVFSKSVIRFPQQKQSQGFVPELSKSIRAMEAEITPFKIKNPVSVMYQSWDYEEVDTRAKVIQGENGYYMLIEIFRYRK